MIHETIYAAIYAQPRGGLKAAMIEALRQAKPKLELKRRTAAGSALVSEKLRIIKGAFNRSSVDTLVERTTRFVFLCKMDSNGAEAALDSFTRQMR